MSEDLAMPSERIPTPVVHYSLNDPRTTCGGAETFARNLALCFEEVEFMTPATLDLERILAERPMVICDHHWVTDLPEAIPAVGFQHGVAARKLLVVPSLENLRMALRQRRASRRPNTLWVAAAQWVSESMARLHGNGAEHVIYHAMDLERYDGRLDNEGSNLVLHDGRVPHKGSRLWPRIARRYPAWRFEPLGCEPEEVPDRLRTARAFVHLSRYEGNSLVCNEAMAMDLPCLFTRVGLLLDRSLDLDVKTVSPWWMLLGSRRLVAAVGHFLEGLDRRRYHPRRWVAEHAGLEQARLAWGQVASSFQRMPWG